MITCLASMCLSFPKYYLRNLAWSAEIGAFPVI